MGIFDMIFGRRPKDPKVTGSFETLTAYRPAFTTWNGQLYESDLVRAAIDAKARHIGKLKVEVLDAPLVARRLKQPNPIQTWGQYLYRLATILEMQNTAFVVPSHGEFNEVTGFYTVLPSQCELVQSNGEPWIRYHFKNGKTAACPLNEVGVMTKFQYEDDIFGSTNKALTSTMELINMQNQGIEEAVKSSATYRFMAQVSNFTKPDDLAKERKRFTAENFSGEGGGLLLFPNTYTNIKQIEPKPYTVDASQMALIKANVFNYFGVNEKILQNIASGDEWASFYEGAIEPFSVQFSDVHTKMLFTDRMKGSVMATANRLQYMSNNDKLNVSAQMADRGLMTINEIRDIWNLPPLEDGDRTIRRGEYKDDDRNE